MYLQYQQCLSLSICYCTYNKNTMCLINKMPILFRGQLNTPILSGKMTVQITKELNSLDHCLNIHTAHPFSIGQQINSILKFSVAILWHVITLSYTKEQVYLHISRILLCSLTTHCTTHIIWKTDSRGGNFHLSSINIFVGELQGTLPHFLWCVYLKKWLLL
jgi:hypothetical protein